MSAAKRAAIDGVVNAAIEYHHALEAYYALQGASRSNVIDQERTYAEAKKADARRAQASAELYHAVEMYMIADRMGAL